MATQSGSPGLVIPCAYDAPGGVPPNMTVLAAQAAAILPNNIQPTNPILGKAPRALLEAQSSAGAVGTKYTNASFTGNTAASGAMSDPGSSAGQNSILPGHVTVSVASPPTFQG